MHRKALLGVRKIKGVFKRIEDAMSKYAEEDPEVAKKVLEQQASSDGKSRKDPSLEKNEDQPDPLKKDISGSPVEDGIDNKDIPDKKTNLAEIPKMELEDIKKAALEGVKFINEQFTKFKKTASYEVGIFENSNLFKTAAALENAVRIIDGMTVDAEIAKIAEDCIGSGLPLEDMSEARSFVNKISSKLDGDIEAVKVAINNQKKAYSLKMGSLSDEESEATAKKNPIEDMFNFFEK